MSEMKTRFRFLVAVCALVLVVIQAPALAGQAPRAVSPGSAASATPVAGPCPTFSWSGSDDATGYELALYRVTESGTLESEFLTRVEGARASSWTPSAAQCPSDHGEYAWAVRALDEDGRGPWSGLMLFATPARPTDHEVWQALDVLRRHRGAGLHPATIRDGPGSVGRGSAHTSSLEATRSEPVLPVQNALTSQTVDQEPSPQAVTAPASFALSLDGDIELGGAVFQGGIPLLHAEGGLVSNSGVGLGALTSVTSGSRNTALGQGALALTTEGSYNTAGGVSALFANTTGRHNTALGNSALQSNAGSYNAAFGSLALTFNGDGTRNTAAGFAALISNSTGYNNVAVGYRTLANNTAGTDNVAVGDRALYNNQGSFNTGIGDFAGGNWTTGDNNIGIGSGASGSAAESGVIRIGGGNKQTQTFIEGISGANVAGVQVLISGDQLGVAASSARFKHHIRDLEGVSDRLQDLRPVTFRYKKEYAGEGAGSVEYGLIAEEVAEIFPELVVRDEDGRPYTVRYHLLTPLLLAEVQRQQQLLIDQRQEVTELRRRLEQLTTKRRLR